ncbi:MAG: GIY-YIG nuclease family protein [Clostridia bacterium]|nr:GIY-YIG nuclease family protein [Clostridia bacterium]
MPYIYKITNVINDKVYVGKTLDTIEKRWKEHCRDYKKERCEKRPLYDAMTKYGIENFKISLLEEVSESEINEKEIYWIETLGSFKYGYNATKGGDGKHYADYDLIYHLFNEGKNNLEIQKLTNYDGATIKKALELKNISDEQRKQRGREVINHSIIMIDKDTDEELKIFPSLKEAYAFLNKQHSGHIASVCKGQRKTAYGYKWRYNQTD